MAKKKQAKKWQDMSTDEKAQTLKLIAQALFWLGITFFGIAWIVAVNASR